MASPTRRYFAIVTMGRSGSTFLERLLDSHPQVVCRGEVFHPGHQYPIDSAKSVAASITDTMFSDIDTLAGFKLPWDHFLAVPPMPEALRDLRFSLVHLRRRNKLDHALSIALAQHNNVWWPQGEYPEQTVSIDPIRLEQHMLGLEWTDRQWEQVCEDFPSIRVDYEDAIRGIGIDDLLSFLGCAPALLHSGIARARTVPRRQAIENFGPLLDHFAGTRWESFFLDEDHLAER